MTLRLMSRLACALTLSGAAVAQSGRTVTLTTPATLGGLARVTVNHPTTAAGNYVELLASGSTPNTVNLGLPSVIGLVRIDMAGYFTAFNGFLDGGGATSTSAVVAIPNNASLIGVVLDVQSADVDNLLNVYLADNDVQLRIVLSICNITMAQSSTSSLTTGNNGLHRIDDNSVGTPVSLGVAPFACQVIRHRGQEGFVEGYAGTFSGTSHNSDIDSLSYRRVAKRTYNGAYQVVSLPNGFDVAITRDNVNQNQFRVLTYNRSTGVPSFIPGTTVVDTSATAPTAAKLQPYMAFSNDGQWGCVVVRDQNTTSPPPDRVLAFRTDGSAPAIDITATTPASAQYFDGSHFFTRDFIVIVGSSGWYYTSATAPSTLLPLTMPNTRASNAPPVFVFPLSWRVARDGAVAYVPVGSNASAARAEMEIFKIENNGGTPLVTNFTQFAAATGLAEFGFSAISPATTNNSSQGIKAAVSPDGTKIACLAATTTTTVFPGVYVAQGAANPTLITAPGATFYSELTFLNNNTVLFFAGTSSTAQNLYKYDLTTNTVTAMTSVGDIRTRGQFWSLNKHWWYFIRSNSASTINNIVAVSAKTGLMKDITGTEFSAPSVPPRHVLRTGSFNTTTDPWFALEFQLRRAPLGDFAYFTARRETGVTAVFEDANVFRFDIENGGQAEILTNNVTQGGQAAILQIESLAISANGQHLAWAQRVNTVATTSEDVFHFRTSLRQMSTSTPSGQTITDGSIHFTCNPPNGIAYSVGTGSTTVPVSNSRIEWVALGTSTPLIISGPAVTTRLYQVLHTWQ